MAQPDDWEIRFHKLLSLLAMRCGAELDELEVDIYDRVLKAHGYQNACRAVEAALAARRGRDAMPSAMDLVEKIQPEVSEKGLATEVASRILAAISRRGHVWPQTYHYDGHATFSAALRAELGEVAEDVVLKMGGWVKVCEESGYVDSTILRAQIRELATNSIRRQALGQLPGQLESRETPSLLGHFNPGALLKGIPS